MASQEQQQRARSLSAGYQNRSISPSFSPQAQYNTSSGLRVDPSLTAHAFPAGTFNANPVSSAGDSYTFSSAYLDSTQLSHTSQSADGQFTQNQGYPQSFESSFVNQLEQPGQNTGAAEENFSNLLNSNETNFDFSLYQNSPSDFDSSSILDQQIHQQSQSPSQSVNPADLVSAMSSPHNPNSPHLFQPDQNSSPGPTSPPSSNPAAFYNRSHSRHTSLDPATAAYMSGQSQSDWQGMIGNPAFQGHRRAPSEHSEVSSVAHSPYMSQQESFDALENNPSPLLSAQNDPTLYDNALGIESFTISEQQHAFSPGHSPYISPQLGPQQTVDIGLDTQFLTSHQINQFPSSGDLYLGSDGQIMNMQQGMSSAEMGQAAQMAPPSINVEFAPPSRNPSFGPGKPPADMDALSPPSIRLRGRSKSDPFGRPATRPMTSNVTSPSLQPQAPSPRSLSPLDPSPRAHSNPGSRDPSPSKSARRQSTSSLDSRSYLLDLADPQRPGASPNESKRTQKHPATFQCTLCPKRFTRAYNLRSHLRTHTDERPFVCTVCGKAFARQHDRKRHEGLHSGEKKFVCRGELSRGGQWGCGRRFARADALGRHFRSEAGRICIKPLLDEEALERDRVLLEQQQQQQQGHLQPVPQSMIIPGMDGQPTGGFALPAALLAQYPALQTLQWDQIAPAAEDPNDLSGRSSFDASSGGEFAYDDDDSGLNSGYNSNRGSLYGVNQGQMGYSMNDWGGGQ